MKIKILSITLMLMLLISACGNAPGTPTTSAEDVQSTAQAAAFTVVAQTHAALPTDTPLPPTEPPTATLAPTNTLEPTSTLDPLLPTLTLIPTETATPLPQPTTSGNDPCNHPLVKWQGPSASFSIVNETKPQGQIILLMSVYTKMGECGWLNIYSTSFSGPVGTYSAGAFVEGPKDFKVFGSFDIQEGSWKVIVRNDVIVAKGSCYPNC